MAIEILQNLCKGCNICVKCCPSNGITLVDKLAVVNDSCTSCGICVGACLFKAIVLHESTVKNDLSQFAGVWVFCEQRDGALMPVVKELLDEGKKLAADLNTYLGGILIGHNIHSLADEVIGYGAEKVFFKEDALFAQYSTEGYTKIIDEAVSQYKPEIVLFGATHIGRDLAPRVAARVNTGLTADCTSLAIDMDERNIMQTRPAFGGNLMATIICPNHRPQMATVRPGVMQKAEFNGEYKGEIITLSSEISQDDIRIRVLEVIKEAGEKASLTEAKVIVAGGMGVVKPEGFELIKKLADKLGGTYAASRACVDAGFIDHSYQVGQTGTTVHPEIYIACGISGAIQHLAGMSESNIIIAINKKEDAPIFEIADYRLVGDLYEIIPEMIAALES